MGTAVWTGALAVSLLSMPVRPVAAQDPPFERIQMSTIVVKPGMTSAYEAQVEVLNEARAKAKDPVARPFWQASRGGPARTFYSVTRFNKWAELESLTMNTDVLAKAFGERKAVRMSAATSDMIESADTRVLTVDVPGLREPANSRFLPLPEGYPGQNVMMQVTFTYGAGLK